MRHDVELLGTVLALCAACTIDAGVGESLSGGGTRGMDDESGESTGSASPGSGPMSEADGSTSSGGGAGIFDVGVPDTGGPEPQCTLGDDIDGIGSCDAPPLSESFEADVQWSWSGDGTARSLVTPLVANLTDDNGDGSIDLCDTPDIVVLSTSDNAPSGEGSIVVLDGDSGPGGDVHWISEDAFAGIFNPALGDIDGDGLVEIVAVEQTGPDLFRLVALSNEGQVEWASPPHDGLGLFGHVVLADMDADGDVEILGGGLIADHEGNEIVTIPGLRDVGASGVAVDLDDDGDLEYIHPLGAHHHDGSPYFAHDEPGILVFPQVADVDDDALPEVIYSSYQSDGITIYEHDGTVKVGGILPELTGLPAAVHDMNGDGRVDIAVGNGSYTAPNYGVLEFDGDGWSSSWSVDVQGGCCAGGTAFDFLGDATAEAMFGDDYQLYIFGEQGQALTTSPRRSGTGTDYPVVADVDNDGSAEIVVVAAEPEEAPAVQVIRDASEGWVQARRIWNQHAYHVTNVREDGTIPQVQPKNWLDLNTFRTQAQIDGSGVCVPAG